GRPLLHRRSPERADQIQGDAGAAGGARERAAVASRGGGRRGGGAEGRRCRRNPARLRGAEGAGDGRRPDGLRGRARRPLQEDPPRRVHRGDPEIAVRQDPAPRPARHSYWKFTVTVMITGTGTPLSSVGS